jgi:hypothetical protein
MASPEPINDATHIIPPVASDGAAQLSQYANSLDQPKPAPDRAAQDTLHPVTIADASAPTNAAESSAGNGWSTPQSAANRAEIAADARSLVQGVETAGVSAYRAVSGFAHEVVTNPTQALSDTKGAIAEGASAVANLYDHPEQIVAGASSILNTVENSRFVAEVNRTNTTAVMNRVNLTPGAQAAWAFSGG